VSKKCCILPLLLLLLLLLLFFVGAEGGAWGGATLCGRFCFATLSNMQLAVISIISMLPFCFIL